MRARAMTPATMFSITPPVNAGAAQGDPVLTVG
jgi:hypothetical protein